MSQTNTKKPRSKHSLARRAAKLKRLETLSKTEKETPEEIPVEKTSTKDTSS